MENDNKNLKQNDFNEKDNSHASIPEINQIPPIPGQETYQDQNPNRGFDPNSNNHSNQYTANQQTEFPQQNQQQFNQQQSYQAQNNYQQPNHAHQNNFKINIPNSAGVLTLGILSILSLCCCGPFLGPILAIIALILAGKAKKAYAANPSLYKQSSLGNLNAGRICAIIGLALGAILLIYFIIMYSINPDNMNEINQAFDEAWNEMGY
ncbi:MAG: hypothetical protein JXR36_13230 [Bacteroidales bacterium]|nr:hypothetical protein [Bacteroidales bacterium]